MASLQETDVGGKQSSKYSPRFLAALSVIATSLIVSVNVANSQEQLNEWSQPTIIERTEGVLAVSSMELVADSSGGIHLFYDSGSGDEQGPARRLNYMHWDGDSWSAPVDVIAEGETGSIRHPKAAIDSAGIVHLIWIGSGNTLYYSHAHASQAGDARKWSTPIPLSEGFDEPAIIAGDDGRLYLATNSVTRQAILFMWSEDSGATWSLPSTIFADTGSGLPSEVGLAADDTGRLHAVWTGHTLPSGDPLTGVYYSRSTDGGVTWSVPYEIDDALHGEINIETSGRDGVHVAWSSSIGGDGKFHAWSTDAGKTWSDAQRLSDAGGQSGMPSFAVDSSGTVHLLFSQAYAAEWKEGRTSELVDLAGPDLRADRASTERAVMTISGGNQLHVVFEHGFQQLAHVIRDLDSPAVALATLVPPAGGEPIGVSVETGEADQEANPAQVPTRASFNATQPYQSNRSTAIVAGAGVASASILILLILYRKLTSR